ncbi:MAG: thioredoxin [Gammaproteobacteria bacterium]|nr:MAG: thioredoxin [Gammaproteobacteria bacterium]
MKRNRDSLVRDVYLEDFAQSVLERSHRVPVLVDFWAEWCAPCLVIAPVLESVVREFAGRVELAKLEVDAGENMKLAGRYAVRGFPTVILFVDGKEVGRFSSARPAQFIRAFLQRHLGRDGGIQVVPG